VKDLQAANLFFDSRKPQGPRAPSGKRQNKKALPYQSFVTITETIIDNGSATTT
jgi:hypothetical protein